MTPTNANVETTNGATRPAPVIGVLALQGDFAEHIRILRRLGVEGREIRAPEDLKGIDGLIIPGGESTTIGKLLVRFGLDKAIEGLTQVSHPLPVWGTCAGMIVLARDIGDSGSKVAPQPLLGLMDLGVRRNAFGTQLDSFEANLDAPEVSPEHVVPAVFIRAPVIERVGEGVEVLARLPDGRPVAARQGPFLATAFHPELTDDLSFHRYFVEQVVGSR
ncbi:MAG TPA: pyridoxal 5'-phosphate synthase glutaminase subunit PdxT [Thermomicrobiales bacterium]|nr:pyridoxal 5'-phosphate synthase glutaminase subunit PdxT [Thermomicrobiales bacterium]